MVQNCIKFFTELILDWISSQAFEIRTKYQVEIFSSTLYSAYPSENQLILKSTKLFLEITAGDRVGLLMFALGPRTKKRRWRHLKQNCPFSTIRKSFILVLKKVLRVLFLPDFFISHIFSSKIVLIYKCQRLLTGDQFY